MLEVLIAYAISTGKPRFTYFLSIHAVVAERGARAHALAVGG